MMYQVRNTLALCIALSLFSVSFLKAANYKVVNLKTEYTETPLGMDVQIPRFSWQMESDVRGSHQKAYQLIVADEAGVKVWDSGKTDSSVSLNIAYGGSSLKPCTRYTWNATVWDQDGKKQTSASWFETGLMDPSPQLTAWSGAKWIGGGDADMVLYSSYLPVFKLSFSIRLDEASATKKAGFVYGANDPRLMDANMNLYGLLNKKTESYLMVEMDVTPLSSGQPAQLHVYRVGYHPKDQKELPLKSFSIPAGIVNAANQYKMHTVYLSSVLGDTRIYMDGESRAHRLGEINLNPLGKGGDFIAFPVLGEIGFKVPKGQAAYFSDVTIRNYRSPSNVLFAENLNTQNYKGIFAGKEQVSVTEGTYRVSGAAMDAFVLADPTQNSMPMLRATFSASVSPVRKARLYVTARGVYEFYMNGCRVGDDYFNPGLTQYPKTHLYQTFDVTSYIQPGKNAIGAMLGEGWWSGGATYMGEFWNFFGDRQSLLAKLVITHTDGTEEVITTNPSTWKYYNNGPVRYGSFFQGEVYDASREALTEGWSTTAYTDGDWKPAVEVSAEHHVSTDRTNKDFNMPLVDDYSGMALTGQFGPTVKKIKELTATSVEEVRPGVFIYDMGQNMAGIPKISLSGMEPGKQITMRFAEVKYPNLPEYKDNVGMVMMENIRVAMSQDIYLAKGGHETISPRFTFHGYRFVEITGIQAPLPLEAVKAEVLSSVHELASVYNTSNSKVNKLWENITWSTYSNFLSIPTDCPQRNERLGWSGDISVFSRTATYLTDATQFLRRHMRAMRDTQREDGRFADVAPLGGGFGGVLWGSAGITVAWESYQQYGDRNLLTEHYPAMKHYIKYLLEKNIDPKTGLLVQEHPGAWGNLGDWLSPEERENDKTLLWESYFIYDLELMEKIATVLDQKADAEYFRTLHSQRKEFFNATYIDPATGKTAYPASADADASSPRKWVDVQASYVLPFAFGVWNKENYTKALPAFIETIKRENKADNGVSCPPYSLMTGFIGTAWMNSTLSDCGYTDVAYRLLQQTSYPSWLYSVEQGATTIWERLNSYTHTEGFGGNNRMNSFNHYSFGAIGAWMYGYSLGIKRDEQSPGFAHFILQPEPDPTGEMTFARGYYESMYGRIESAWELNGNTCVYDFGIPANTSATLRLKAASASDITQNGKPLGKLKGVKFTGLNNGLQTFELPSGIYHIEVRGTGK